MSRHHRRHRSKSRQEQKSSKDKKAYINTDYREVDDNNMSLIEKPHTNQNKKYSIGSRNFHDNFKKYIGKLVTVYTISSDTMGTNFSGLLIGANRHFIRLASKLNESFQDENYYDPYNPDTLYEPDSNDNSANTEEINKNYETKESLIDVPINKIAVFVHN